MMSLQGFAREGEEEMEGGDTGREEQEGGEA